MCLPFRFKYFKSPLESASGFRSVAVVYILAVVLAFSIFWLCCFMFSIFWLCCLCSVFCILCLWYFVFCSFWLWCFVFFIFWLWAPKEGRGCLMFPSCLESQSCHQIPLFYLLSRSSTYSFCSLCLILFQLMTQSPDFFPKKMSIFRCVYFFLYGSC